MSRWFDPEAFRDLVAGRRRGLLAGLLRGALGLVAVPYRWAVVRRNRWYDAHPEAIHRAAVPVVSVGNLTLGGTGKTPLVEWLVRRLRRGGRRPAIISRGYGSQRGTANDEALELEQKLPGVPHLQNPDRVAAAHQAVERHAAEVLVLDDAFQHRRMGRDLDIVLLDALEPFGFDRVFPRGTLREPVEGLKRADAIVLSRADLLDAAAREAIGRRAAALAPAALWLEAVHEPQCLVAADGRVQPLDGLAGRTVAAFCGIGNPAGFRHTLALCGCEVAVFRTFADHHAYSQTDLDEMSRAAETSSAEALVCTEKDLVKLRDLRVGRLPLWAVRIGLRFLTDPAPLESRLAGLFG